MIVVSSSSTLLLDERFSPLSFLAYYLRLLVSISVNLRGTTLLENREGNSRSRSAYKLVLSQNAPPCMDAEIRTKTLAEYCDFTPKLSVHLHRNFGVRYASPISTPSTNGKYAMRISAEFA